MSGTSETLQKHYNEQYRSDEISSWRLLGAIQKADNILNVVGQQQFNKVLEYGAGEGSILEVLSKNNQFKSLYACEISESGIQKINDRNIPRLQEVRKFDGYDTGFKDKEFDLVYCSHVIEHVEYPRILLREIQRISKNQVFEVPLDYRKNVDLQMDHYLGYGHINIYTPSLFKFLIKSENYHIISEEYSNLSHELLELLYLKNQKFKKKIIRDIVISLKSRKAKLASLILGKSISKEYYYSAYTCFTKSSQSL